MSDLDTRIRVAAADYLGWTYPAQRSGQRYVARSSSLIRLPVATNDSERIIDCSTMAAAILAQVYPDAIWDRGSYADLQMYADRLPGRPDAPVQALVRANLGVEVTAPNAPGWYLVQGWRSLGSPPDGHALLVLRETSNGGLVLLESTSLERRGPRWRRTTLRDLESEFHTALYFARLR